MAKFTKKAVLDSLTPGRIVWVRNVDGSSASAWRRRTVVKATAKQLVVTKEDNAMVWNVWTCIASNGKDDGGFLDQVPGADNFLEYALVEPRDLSAVGDSPVIWGGNPNDRIGPRRDNGRFHSDLSVCYRD